MSKIPADEVQIISATRSDRNGTLFEWKGSFYRGIRSKAAPLYQRLFDAGIVDQLVEKKLLIDTERVENTLPDYDLLLRHRRLPFITYAYEWSPHMLKDAALLLLDLNLKLAKDGLATQDAHSQNIVFDGCRPIYVDFSSIVEMPLHQPWPAYKEFKAYFLRPLYMYSLGQSKITRWLLHDYDNGVQEHDYKSVVPFGIIKAGSFQVTKASLKYDLNIVSKNLWKQMPITLKKFFRQGIKQLPYRERREQHNQKIDRNEFLQRIRREVEAIKFPILRTEWSNYYEHMYPDFIQSDNWTLKHINVARIISELQPRTMLDIGSNRGWYSQFAARNGSKVVAIDTDEPSVDWLFENAKLTNQSILPLVLDITNPSPGYGLCNEWLLPAMERLECDLVLILALVHHLVFKKALDFSQISKTLAKLSKEWLLVEFVPCEDRFVSAWYSEEYDWYTLDNFLQSLSKHFQVVKIMDSYEAPRQLILCAKKK